GSRRAGRDRGGAVGNAGPGERGRDHPGDEELRAGAAAPGEPGGVGPVAHRGDRARHGRDRGAHRDPRLAAGRPGGLRLRGGDDRALAPGQARPDPPALAGAGAAGARAGRGGGARRPGGDPLRPRGPRPFQRGAGPVPPHGAHPHQPGARLAEPGAGGAGDGLRAVDGRRGRGAALPRPAPRGAAPHRGVPGDALRGRGARPLVRGLLQEPPDGERHAHPAGARAPLRPGPARSRLPPRHLHRDREVPAAEGGLQRGVGGERKRL
ncbi:MAG: tRNA (cytidine(32)/uridine(32)-2'-O)-methyltransferase, partial [uncultured Gemmatimonadetes bacterium]